MIVEYSKPLHKVHNVEYIASKLVLWSRSVCYYSLICKEEAFLAAEHILKLLYITAKTVQYRPCVDSMAFLNDK